MNWFRLLIVIWLGVLLAALCSGCASPVFGQTTYRTQTNVRPNGVVVQWCSPWCRQQARPAMSAVPLNPLPSHQPTTRPYSSAVTMPPAAKGVGLEAQPTPTQPLGREDVQRAVLSEIERLRPILTAQIRSELSGELNEMLPGFRREMESTAVEQVSRAGPTIQSRTLDAIAPKFVQLESRVGDVARSHPELLAKVANLTKTVGGLSEGMGGLAGEVLAASSWAKFGAIGGPAGMAAAVAAGFLFRRVTRRASGAATPSEPSVSPSPSSDPHLRLYRPVAVDSPPTPQRVIHSNTFTPVELDSTDEALTWALDQQARRNPGSTSTCEAIRSLMTQYRDAKSKP